MNETEQQSMIRWATLMNQCLKEADLKLQIQEKQIYLLTMEVQHLSKRVDLLADKLLSKSGYNE